MKLIVESKGSRDDSHLYIFDGPSKDTTKPADWPDYLIGRIYGTPEVFIGMCSNDQGILGIEEEDEKILTNQAHAVSREHLGIHIEQNRVIIKDLNSSNGTYVKGIQITNLVLPEGRTEVALGTPGDVESLDLSLTYTS